MKFAYADPPYIGQSRRHYSKHPDFAGEVDHKALLECLQREYPDGWALSASSSSLKLLLPLCPSTVRVAAWVKPFAAFKVGVNPAYTWEPVIFNGGRKGPRTRLTVKDHLARGITMKKGLVGAKPEPFCYWVFDLLGANGEDQLDDLFPGTGAVISAWNKFVLRML